MGGSLVELMKFNIWLGTLPAKKILLVPGNHDFICEELPQMCKQELTHATLLIDEFIEIDGKRFYGSPWVPEYGRWAFMKPDHDLVEVFSKIPEDLDMLITHGPPKKVLDKVERDGYVGSESLFNRCLKAKPRFNVFGHIHEGYGRMEFGWFNDSKTTTFLNASSCDVRYKPVNPAVTFEI
jgi:Icc-related predicted phosphoesterase